MNQLLAAAAEADGSISPVYFILGGLAVVVVSILGPLSRLHERRDQKKKAKSTPELGSDQQ